MKKYSICLFLFLAVSAVCVTVGLAARKAALEGSPDRAAENAAQTEASAAITEAPTQTAEEDYQVANQRQVGHETVAEEYYLVAEDGFLLVFLKDKETICLYTHMPVMDFPPKERDRLREGIWFRSMMEVFNYLESYTS